MVWNMIWGIVFIAIGVFAFLKPEAIWKLRSEEHNGNPAMQMNRPSCIGLVQNWAVLYLWGLELQRWFCRFGGNE